MKESAVKEGVNEDELLTQLAAEMARQSYLIKQEGGE